MGLVESKFGQVKQGHKICEQDSCGSPSKNIGECKREQVKAQATSIQQVLFKKSPVIKEHLSDADERILIMARVRSPLLKQWQ